MKVSFSPRYPQTRIMKKGAPSFGSFPLPQCHHDSIMIRYQAHWKKLLPTPDNIESMKAALKANKCGTVGPLQEVVVDIWKMKLEDFPGAAPMIN